MISEHVSWLRIRWILTAYNEHGSMYYCIINVLLLITVWATAADVRFLQGKTYIFYCNTHTSNTLNINFTIKKKKPIYCSESLSIYHYWRAYLRIILHLDELFDHFRPVRLSVLHYAPKYSVHVAGTVGVIDGPSRYPVTLH